MAKKTKTKCEVATEFCNKQIVRAYKGKKKDDPVFYACCVCVAMLRRYGVKFKEYSG